MARYQFELLVRKYGCEIPPVELELIEVFLAQYDKYIRQVCTKDPPEHILEEIIDVDGPDHAILSLIGAFLEDRIKYADMCRFLIHLLDYDNLELLTEFNKHGLLPNAILLIMADCKFYINGWHLCDQNIAPEVMQTLMSDGGLATDDHLQLGCDDFTVGDVSQMIINIQKKLI